MMNIALTLFKILPDPRRKRPFGPSESPGWLRSLISAPLVCDSVRERMAKIDGGEKLEFLLAYVALQRSTNPLQRFEQFRGIVHRFVRENAARQIGISNTCRQELLTEWSRWASGTRLPMQERLRSLEKAAAAIHEEVSKHGPLGAMDHAMFPAAGDDPPTTGARGYYY